MLEAVLWPSNWGKLLKEDKTQRFLGLAARRPLFLPRFKGFSAMTPGKNML